MAIWYGYAHRRYYQMADAQAAVPSFKALLDNEPNRYMRAKEVTASGDGWIISGVELTNQELLNPDPNKMYMCYSRENGEHLMPLTGSELKAKQIEYRTIYAREKEADVVVKWDDTKLTTQSFPTDIDMSGYV